VNMHITIVPPSNKPAVVEVEDIEYWHVEEGALRVLLKNGHERYYPLSNIGYVEVHDDT